jgi:hypothetical protein
MIALPAEIQFFYQGDLYLGKSEMGVYSAMLWQENEWSWCRVWLLDESSGWMEWVLKSNISLQMVAQNFPFDNDRYSRPWIVNDKEHANEAQVDDEFEWDFDNGITLPETNDNEVESSHAVFLGFHPYKEIAFFSVSYSRVVSYHLKTLRVQELGILIGLNIIKSFPYTPCWMGELSEKKMISSKVSMHRQVSPAVKLSANSCG